MDPIEGDLPAPKGRSRPSWRQRLGKLWFKVRPWLPFAVVVVLLYLLVSTVQPSALLAAAEQFSWPYLLPLIGIYLVYLVLRALRWHLLMRPLGAPNSIADSILLFAGAQAALVVPAGQFLLPVLQKSQHGTLIRRSAATVLVQELIFGILVIPAALPAVPTNPFGVWLLAAALIVSLGAGTLMLHPGLSSLAVSVIRRVSFLRKHVPNLLALQANVALVATTWEAILGSVLDMAAVAAAGTSFYIGLVALGQAQVGWTGATAAFAFGNAAAVVSSLPGGLGATEDTTTAVLSQLGMSAAHAAAATLIFRAATLLMGTIVGWMVLIVFRRRFCIHPTVPGLLAAIRHGAKETETGETPNKLEDPALQPLQGD